MYGIEKAFALGATVEQLFDATKIDPWFLDQFQQIHELGDKVRAAEPNSTRRCCVRPSTTVSPTARSRLCVRTETRSGEDARARAARRARRAPGLQDRRHLRGGVRGQDAVPLLDLRARSRSRDRGCPADRAAQGADPRIRSQPHRPGHRVRLLVCARGADAVRGRLRDRHGQLQPRDRLHRLRHRRPPVLRAADVRGRPRGLPRGGAVGHRCRRHRAARRPDPARVWRSA